MRFMVGSGIVARILHGHFAAVGQELEKPGRVWPGGERSDKWHLEHDGNVFIALKVRLM